MKKSAYQRILLKLSGEALAGDKQSGIHFDALKNFCDEIAEIRKSGVQLAIVVGGGNFWRYRDFKNSGLDRVHSDYMGMVSTVLNALALQNTLRQAGIGARALSAIAMPQVAETYIRDKALQYLEGGEVVICAGGTGSPFFTTDTTAALRALELNCQLLLKATNVDYVYDSDPDNDKNAKSFTHITYAEVLEKSLGVMDLSAISLCRESSLPIHVFNLHTKGNMMKVLENQNIGTRIS